MLRLQAMKEVLQQRDRYQDQYLKLRSILYNNGQKLGPIDSLATLLSTVQPPSDSSVTTTEKRITTITFQVESEKKKNFFTRLLSGKKKAEEIPISEVKEELTVKIDTRSVNRSDSNSTLQEFGKMIKVMEASQQFKSKQLQKRELELVNTKILLINELLTILQEVESEEILAAQQITDEASTLVRHSSRNIG